MASSVPSLVGLFFAMSACSIYIMANPIADRVVARHARETVIDLHQQRPAEQVDPFVDVPVNQAAVTTGAPATAAATVAATAAATSMMTSEESESSEEMTSEEEETADEVDADAAGDTAAATPAAANVNGGFPSPNVELSNNDAASAKLLPIMGSKHSPSGDHDVNRAASSSTGAGVAIAVVLMVALVVGSIVFIIKKYKHNFPVFVRL